MAKGIRACLVVLKIKDLYTFIKFINKFSVVKAMESDLFKLLVVWSQWRT